MRLHGATELYQSRYSDAELRCWADRLRAWSAGDQPPDANLVMPDAKIRRVPRDVFCYFDNTDKLHAPSNARQLMQMLNINWMPAVCLERRQPACASAADKAVVAR